MYVHFLLPKKKANIVNKNGELKKNGKSKKQRKTSKLHWWRIIVRLKSRCHYPLQWKTTTYITVLVLYGFKKFKRLSFIFCTLFFIGHTIFRFLFIILLSFPFLEWDIPIAFKFFFPFRESSDYYYFASPNIQHFTCFPLWLLLAFSYVLTLYFVLQEKRLCAMLDEFRNQLFDRVFFPIISPNSNIWIDLNKRTFRFFFFIINFLKEAKTSFWFLMKTILKTLSLT